MIGRYARGANMRGARFVCKVGGSNVNAEWGKGMGVGVNDRY